MQKIHSKDYAELEKTINHKLRKVGPNYGIRNLHRTPRGRYGFEMRVSVDPRDEAKWYLPESLVERVKSRAKKKGVSQSALVAECLAEAL